MHYHKFTAETVNGWPSERGGVMKKGQSYGKLEWNRNCVTTIKNPGKDIKKQCFVQLTFKFIFEIFNFLCSDSHFLWKSGILVLFPEMSFKVVHPHIWNTGINWKDSGLICLSMGGLLIEFLTTPVAVEEVQSSIFVAKYLSSLYLVTDIWGRLETEKKAFVASGTWNWLVTFLSSIQSTVLMLLEHGILKFL